MTYARNLAVLLAVGALAASPALAQSRAGGTQGNAKIPPTHNLQGQNNQAPAEPADAAQSASNQPNLNNQNNLDHRNLSPSEVARMQAQLKQMGAYHGSIDGVWGPQTRKAVAEIQRQKGLQPTGTLDVAAAQQLGLLTPSQENNNKRATNRFQGRSGAATRPGSATSPGGMQQLYGGGGGTAGGSGYVNGNFASVTNAAPSGGANTSPPGFFGYSSNMSNGFNASRGGR